MIKKNTSDLPENFFKKIVRGVVREETQSIRDETQSIRKEMKNLATKHELELMRLDISDIKENLQVLTKKVGDAIGMLANALTKLNTRESEGEAHQLQHDDLENELERLKRIHPQDPNNPSRFVHI